MLQRIGYCVAINALVLACSAGISLAQGHPSAEAASRMTVPDGLEVKLFAAEPMVRQPVCVEFDDRGRMWVIQYLQYPNPAGLSRVKVDRYSRTVYDKTPEPPPRGEKGADRITILEDTDRDGDADVAKDFVSGLNIASGLAFGHGGVFVLNPPYLLFYADRNGDDVPDGDPEVLLTGFGIEDAHSVANNLMWGPDGWLYGCQGSTVTANIRGVEFQQGLWRYHPLTRKFELFCEGGGNSWGLDFDPHGHLLYNTNHGGYILLHAVQGAYYWKSFGKHGPLHNPYAYGYFDHAPHANFQGGHVSVGGVIYHGTALPETFRGKFIAADLLDHSVHWHDVTPDGSSFKTAHGGDLLRANDTWFASSDMTMGPDGAIYVCDFHDQRTAHPDPDAEWDRSNGRIYRIAGKGHKPYDGPDVSKLSRDELLAMLSIPTNWSARRARRVLADRRDPEVILPLRQMVREGDTQQLAIEAFWALYVSGGLSQPFANECLTHLHPAVRRWAVRVLGDEQRVSPAIARRFEHLARSEADVHVLSQLACTAKRLPAEQALPIIEQLVSRDSLADDPHIPMLLWWAVERHCIADEDVSLFFERAWKTKIARNVINPRLARRYAAEGTEESLERYSKLLHWAPGSRALLEALEQGLAECKSKPDAATLQGLADQIRMVWDEKANGVVVRVLARLGDAGAVKHARDVALDANSAPELRTAMVRVVGDFGTVTDATPLLGILGKAGAPDQVQAAALAASSRFDDDAIPRTILGRYKQLPASLRPKAIDLLLGRKTWAVRLLDAVDTGAVAATDVSLDQLRQVSAHNDKTLDARIAKRWGRITGGTPEEKLAEVRRFNNDLRAAAGDAVKGRELYANTCAVCHKLNGEGGAVGPDLTHANRTDRDYLLVSIIDPSAVVRAEHLSYIVRTTDGRLLTGLLAEQNQAGVTLLDAKAQRVTVPREDVKDLKESPVSLMPEGLLTQFTPQQLRDLFAYIQSSPAN